MKVIPLEEHLISPFFKKKCVYYKIEIFAIYEGYMDILFEEERSIEYLSLEKPEIKTYEERIPLDQGLKDPFILYTAKDVNKLIRTDLIGIVVREKVIELK